MRGHGARGMSVLVRLLRETAVQRRIPPHVLDFVAQHVRHLGRSLVRLTRRACQSLAPVVVRRHVAGVPDTVRMVHTGGTWQAAVDFPFATVRQVAQDTLATVCGLLESADVAYFVRDVGSVGATVIGVHEADRRRVWNALAAAAPCNLLYIRGVADDDAVALWRGAKIDGELARSERVLMYRNYRITDAYVIGASNGCIIEFWHRAGHDLRPPAGARAGRLVLSDRAPTRLVVGDQSYPTLLGVAGHRRLSASTPPIDAVYTWVDDTDPRWRRSFDRALAAESRPLHAEAANPSRFHCRDELRYSLRSLSLYADFVRHIYLVTDQQVPEWLRTDHPQITVVDHREIFGPDAALPTFNSHAIESRLHHIEGLSEHYLYMNDDFLFGREVNASTFFTTNGLARLFPDELAPIPSGPPTLDDRPVDSASKNVRELMSRLGVYVDCKIRHVPYPQRRSVLIEMEQRFPEEFERTTASRFRRPTDINIPSCFAQYYAFATERAVLGDIDAEYVNVNSRWSGLQMRRLLDHRDRDAFCLNETQLPQAQVAAVDRAVRQFLEAYLPVPSPWERPADHSPSGNPAMSVDPYVAAPVNVISDAVSARGLVADRRLGHRVVPPFRQE
jgi:hypothetical protein